MRLKLDLSKILDQPTRYILKQLVDILNSPSTNNEIANYIASKTVTGEILTVSSSLTTLSPLSRTPRIGTVKLYVNGLRLAVNDYRVDYTSKIITMSSALVLGDEVVVDYMS